jgi:hypothetical protein
VARPEGLEPPAYWFEAKNQRNIGKLAVGTMVVHGCAELRVIKDFAGAPDRALLALVRNCSMQGVGTKVGTDNWEQKGRTITCRALNGNRSRDGWF